MEVGLDPQGSGTREGPSVATECGSEVADKEIMDTYNDLAIVEHLSDSNLSDDDCMELSPDAGKRRQIDMSTFVPVVKKPKPVALRDWPPECYPREVKKSTVTVQAVKGKGKAKGPAKEESTQFCVETAPSEPVTFIGEELEEADEEEARTKVKGILKRFDALRRSFLHQRETLHKSGVRPSGARPEQRAGKEILNRGERFSFKGVGIHPGVRVGDQFFYRFELLLVGLHNQSQGGIAWLGTESEWGKHVACSVIVSGGYDDEDNGETLVYTGQGGNNYFADKREGYDQKAERGNLALQNSCKLNLPVRVIRGCKMPGSSPSGKIYSYDGLYKIERYWMEDSGKEKYMVFKFFLRRLPGQPELGSNVVKFMGRLSHNSSLREGVVLEDISYKMERLPVYVVNTVDVDRRLPEPYEYTTTVRFPLSIPRPAAPQCCDCEDGCDDAKSCSCLARNHGGQLAYNYNGHLVRARKVVYECGPNCKCNENCYNRVSQKGMKHRLEVFKTANTGWGVRSWDIIPSGSFVAEYTGDMLAASTANELENDEYLFNLDFKKGNAERWGDVSDVIDESTMDSPTCPLPDSAEFVIDARKSGSLARFINHSCNPNLFVQCVLYDHHDFRFPHVMLFATENIPAFKELTYDYGYTVNGVLDANGKIATKACECRSAKCSGRLY